MDKTLREVCKEVQVSRRAVQGFENIGLVQRAGKTKMGHVLYSESEIEKIRRIKFLQDVGFSLREIKQFFWSSTLEQLHLLRVAKERVDRGIAEQNKLAAKLEHVIESYVVKGSEEL